MENGWNPWHGCTKVSPGCAHCYVYRMDAERGLTTPTSVCRKTGDFNLPVRRTRAGTYKILPGTLIYTCFTSDFFLDAADAWRPDAWRMIAERSDCHFLFFTKRPERIPSCLPADWGDGYANVTVGCTVENNAMAGVRLPLFLTLPLPHRIIGCEPLLESVDLSPYLSAYPGTVESVSVGGESGPDARVCDYDWVLYIRQTCVSLGIPFSYHQTGARLRKGGRVYDVPRDKQHDQAKRAGIDFSPDTAL